MAEKKLSLNDHSRDLCVKQTQWLQNEEHYVG